MKLIIGLGNPGKEYETTRHNVGFKAIDLYAHHKDLKLNKRRFNGIFYKGKDFVLAKPHTYMNLSGLFVARLIKYFKVDLENVLIIYDDINLPIGTIRYRTKGSSGGQKGMQDIIERLNTNAIQRLRIGIGKPHNNIKNYVLQPFSPMQISKLDEQKATIIQQIEEFITK